MKKQKIIIINKLDKHQHYKDRHIIWIKLYIDVLQDYKFQQLEDRERWIFIGLILLAVKNDNKVPHDVHFITNNICFRKKNNLKRIQKLCKTIKKLKQLGLISIESLSECLWGDSPEKKREDKIREEITLSSNKNLFKEMLTAYKEGQKPGYRPFTKWDEEMRWQQNKWRVIPKEGGEWLEFAEPEGEGAIKLIRVVK